MERTEIELKAKNDLEELWQVVDERWKASVGYLIRLHTPSLERVEDLDSILCPTCNATIRRKGTMERIGIYHCKACGQALQGMTKEEYFDKVINSIDEGKRKKDEQ